jgi:hypothetical protein
MEWRGNWNEEQMRASVNAHEGIDEGKAASFFLLHRQSLVGLGLWLTHGVEVDVYSVGSTRLT